LGIVVLSGGVVMVMCQRLVVLVVNGWWLWFGGDARWWFDGWCNLVDTIDSSSITVV
jgi:hypothetical protein